MSDVPFVGLKAQYTALREEIRAAIDRVCDAQAFVLGEEVASLESEIAAFTGAPYAIGVSSGTDALLAALMAEGVGPGDEVVTTAYSFFATAGVIARLGAKPVFVDIDPESFNLDPKAAVASVTERTRAIVPVHLFGRCADLDPILDIARERGIAVVEDAAQALGTRDAAGREAGTLGATGCISFFPTKNLGGFGDGGMVITCDEARAEKLRSLRVHGTVGVYDHAIVGGNFRLDAIQAAVLRVKLPHLRGWIAARRERAERYREQLQSVGSHVTLPRDVAGHAMSQFVIRTPARDALRAFLAKAGVQTQVYYPIPLHLQACFRDLGYGAGDYPMAEAAAADSLALPLYPELSDGDQDRVVAAIGDFFDRS